ncbi:hypothetical protein [Candidatus Mesenet endosymbiont of Agriotes lineatus]|uniref:hypothetical protein n=1 Tax=Candidatus Mesenet endosymbiont of Agriotes lineatus TaxID=3077948 RepID=UPI0030D1B46C
MKQFKNIIFRQWITSDPKRLRDEIGENKNVIPNTKNFPYIYTIIETAKQDPETLQCIFYLGNNLSDMQKQEIKEIEELAQNIFTIQFDSKELKPLWEKYNFQTRTDLLNPLLQEGKEIDILSWLSEPNDDSLMGFRVDFM